MANARFWKKWLRLGEWWLRRRITSVSSSRLSFVNLVYALFCQTTPYLYHVQQRSPCSLIFGVARYL